MILSSFSYFSGNTILANRSTAPNFSLRYFISECKKRNSPSLSSSPTCARNARIPLARGMLTIRLVPFRLRSSSSGKDGPS